MSLGSPYLSPTGSGAESLSPHRLGCCGCGSCGCCCCHGCRQWGIARIQRLVCGGADCVQRAQEAGTQAEALSRRCQQQSGVHAAMTVAVGDGTYSSSKGAEMSDGGHDLRQPALVLELSSSWPSWWVALTSSGRKKRPSAQPRGKRTATQTKSCGCGLMDSPSSTTAATAEGRARARRTTGAAQLHVGGALPKLRPLARLALV